MILKQSFTLLILLIKKQIRRIPYTVAIILLPIIIAILISSNILVKNDKNIIGLYNAGEDAVAIGTVEYLLDNSYQVQFVEYTSLTDMLNDIANSRIDCGYGFPDDLTDRLNHNSKDSVILYLNDAESIVASYSNELIFAGILYSGAYDMLTNYAINEPYLNNSDALSIIESNFATYIQSDDVFSLQKEDITIDDTDDFNIDQLNSNASIRSFIGICIMLAGLIGVINRSNSINSEAFKVMNAKVFRLSSFSYAAAYEIPVSLSMIILLIATNSSKGLIDVLNMILLIVASAVFSGLLSSIITNPRILAGSVPTLLMLCIFIYPLIFDLIMFAPVLKYIRFILPPQYFNLF